MRSSRGEPIEDVMGWALSFDAMREIDRIVRAQVKDPVGPKFMAPPARHQLKAAWLTRNP
jgi:hypothetical protein